MKFNIWQKGDNTVKAESLKGKKLAIAHIKDKDKVLDIGCGDCNFFDLVSTKRKGCELFAYDIVPKALKIAKTKGYYPIRKLNVKQKFDVITMFDVIEHLDLSGRLKYVKDINKALKSKGYVVLSFPHTKSFLGLARYYYNLEHKPPVMNELNTLMLFEGYKIIDKTYFNPWKNPFKIISCLITGASFDAIYNQVCLVLQKLN